MFIIFNKDKILSYLISISTVTILLVLSFAITKNNDEILKTSTNTVIENQSTETSSNQIQNQSTQVNSNQLQNQSIQTNGNQMQNQSTQTNSNLIQKQNTTENTTKVNSNEVTNIMKDG